MIRCAFYKDEVGRNVEKRFELLHNVRRENREVEAIPVAQVRQGSAVC